MNYTLLKCSRLTHSANIDKKDRWEMVFRGRKKLDGVLEAIIFDIDRYVFQIQWYSKNGPVYCLQIGRFAEDEENDRANYKKAQLLEDLLEVVERIQRS